MSNSNPKSIAYGGADRENAAGNAAARAAAIAKATEGAATESDFALREEAKTAVRTTK